MEAWNFSGLCLLGGWVMCGFEGDGDDGSDSYNCRGLDAKLRLDAQGYRT